ncbi:cytochrome c [Pistricoccus aurantiacus]|uniref:Cytochrome c n=1 Tax=Pistricoccus aurantiacus TaxID=1883414 RepID=A0A5B8SWM9_9GAMM|nr:cytochrome c [Pistricoccus aurantiacus]QEA40567.1 cytochrome c [Pistricoccus aurantiacus]
MQHPHRFITLSVTVVSAVLIAIIPAWAADDTEPLELRSIMQELGEEMQTITDGISREDWALVAETAPMIANHSQPSAIERMRILGFLGTDASTFRNHDKKIQQAALQLEKAAENQNGAEVIAAFATLQNRCLACHQDFRNPFMEHFYDDP